MQIGFKHSTKEWDQYITQVRKKFPEKVKLLIAKTTQDLSRGTKQDAPMRYSGLKQSVRSKVQGYTGEVEVRAHYAPYLEFGTGSGFSAPTEFIEFASQFKVTNPFTGRKPVNIRGVGWRMVQFPLNLKARPYFHPNFVIQRDKFFKQVEKALKEL